MLLKSMPAVRRNSLAITVAVLCASLFAPSASAQLAQTLQYQATDLGALGFVHALNVNARGDVLGIGADNRYRLYSQGKVSVVGISASSYLSGYTASAYLNDAGQVAGSEFNAGTSQWESRLYSNGIVSSLNISGKAQIAGFNASGQILAVDRNRGLGYLGTSDNLVEFEFSPFIGHSVASLNNTGLIVNTNEGNVVAFRVSDIGSVQLSLIRNAYGWRGEYDSVDYRHTFGVSSLNDNNHIILISGYSQTCSNTYSGMYEVSCEYNQEFQNYYTRNYSLYDLNTNTEVRSLGGTFVSDPYNLDYYFRAYSLNNHGDFVAGDVYGDVIYLADGSFTGPALYFQQYGRAVDDLFGGGALIGDNRHLLISGQAEDNGDQMLLLLTPVPEPSAAFLLTMGLAGVLLIRRPRKDQS